MWPARTRYGAVEVMGHRIFYREAGDPRNPAVVLLHGYPSSSHTYRHLIPLLSGRFHVIAPDNLGSGFSAHPGPKEVDYSFDLLAESVRGFLRAKNLHSYFLYLQDFGGPVGFRVAIENPEAVRGIVVQNANAYLEGLTPARRAFFRGARDDDSEEAVADLHKWVSDHAIRETQYLRDVPGERARYMSPDTWTHDIAMMPTEEDRWIQVQLFRDYQNNIDDYPKWQEYLRTHAPPLLILWGERDSAFIAAGAKAYLKDAPQAQLHLLDAGHFAAEEQPVEVAKAVIAFAEGQR